MMDILYKGKQMEGVARLIPSPQGKPLEFDIPMTPPSVNHYRAPRKGGGFYTTNEAQAYIDAVCMIGRTAAPCMPIPGRFYEVEIVVFLRRSQFLKWDADNYSKVAVDSIAKHAGILKDDRYMTRFHISKLPVELAAQERTHYKIIGREEP